MTFGQVRNIALASDVGRANLLVNGGMEIWQRGSGPISADGAGCADGWFNQHAAGSGTHVVTQETSVVDGPGSSASLKAVYTAGASDATFGLRQGWTDIIKQIRGRTVTYSMRVYAPAGKVRLGWYDGVTGGATRQYSAANQSTNTWETVSVTMTPAATATSGEIEVEIIPGSSFTYYVDNATLAVGSVAVAYTPLHPADEMTRCQRYFQKFGGYSAAFASNSGYAAAGGYAGWWVLLPTNMVTTPSLTKVGTWALVNCNQPTMSQAGPDGFQMYVTATAAGNTNFYCQDATTYVTLEANV